MTDIFYGTSGPRNAPIAIVGEAWGRNEAREKKPFVGESGELLRRMLAEAGLDMSQCFITNVFPRKPESEAYEFFHKTAEKTETYKGLRPTQQVLNDVKTLHLQLNHVRPRVIVALGNYALWALTDSSFSIGNEAKYKVPTGITTWRGSYLWADAVRDTPGCADFPPTPLIPTYHPAAIMRQWPWRQTGVHDLRARVAPLAKGGVVPPEPGAFIVAPSFDETMLALHYLQHLPAGQIITCDVETRANHIDCIGFAWDWNKAICIPLCSVFTGEPYFTREQEGQVHAAIQVLFQRHDLLWSNQNISYDLQYLDLFCYRPPRPSFDTMVAHHLCYPGTPKALDYLSSLYCEHHRYWGESSDHTTDRERWFYNCYDTTKTWEITRELRQIVKHLKLETHMQERLDVMYEVALPMMIEGCRIDVAERRIQALGVFEAMQEAAFWLNKIMPQWMKDAIRGKTSKSEWYDSPTQQMSLFYEIFGLRKVINAKTKRPTVDDDALPQLAIQEPVLKPIIEVLQHYRSMGVYYRNFLIAALDWDDRMRCSFDITGTITFRWNSGKNAFGRGTNLQNVPKEKEG